MTETTSTKSKTYYKAFNSDLTCRGFQYADGETFEHDGPVEPCYSGFHACEAPLDVLRYYPPAGAVFRVVELEDVSSHEGGDSKVAARKIKLGAKIDIAGLVKAQVEYVSRYVKLLPGDLLATGSPAGNGMHHGVFLKPGDVMQGSITGLGAQRNTFSRES